MPISFTSTHLRQMFGSQSHIAQQIVPALAAALSPQIETFQQWRETIELPAAKHFRPLHDLYGKQDAYALLFALRTYYALVVKVLAAVRLGRPQTLKTIENGEFFREQGIHNLMALDTDYGALAQGVDGTSILQAAAQFTFDDSPPDALKALYQDLFPSGLRHALGEYYTPDWLAEQTLNRVGFQGEGRLLDPACGSGTFLVLALRRMQKAGVNNPLAHLAGIDVNPLACLAAQANLLLAIGKPDGEITLPIHCADSILQPPPLGEFEYVVGNPPWVNWQTLSEDYRQQTRHVWEQYGLFAHSGMDAILGKGKKDLSLLLTLRSADQYLKHGGKLGFILTEAALKTGGASAGFRRFLLPGDVPLRVLQVDDLSRVAAFDGAAARALVLVLEKGTETQYPVPYCRWRRKKHVRLGDDLPLPQIMAKTNRVEWAAAPMQAADSAWLTGHPAALDAVRKLSGESDYEAHAGVYTGGANAVYWLDVLEDAGEWLRVRNITAGAKRPVPRIESWIEARFVYPLLRGNEVWRWKAKPSIHILLVQDPQTRRGYAPDWLRDHAPHTWAYLAQFEAMLRERAAYRRYYQPQHPFYSMFNVGLYSFAPVKVVWKGFGTKRMKAAVISTQAGKPIMTNQAMHPFIGLQDESEAHYLAASLNSAAFEYAVLSQGQVGGKSFAQPGLLKLLRLPRYEANHGLHQALANLSRDAHAGSPDDAAIAATTADLWGLSLAEQRDILQSLGELTR